MIIGQDDGRRFLRSLFDISVKSADPKRLMKQNLPGKPKGRTIVVGAGKASAQMAMTLEEIWNGPMSGLVVTQYGQNHACKQIDIVHASHPIPDEAGLFASKRLLEYVSDLTSDDLVIALISGGGSSLLPAPAIGLTLQDEMDVNYALLQSGAPIGAMNLLRKHISHIKGGRLAFAAAPAKVVTFIVSDVPGDIAHFVASGPTAPDSSTNSDALIAAHEYKIPLAPKLLHFLGSIQANAPMPCDHAFDGNEVHIVASAKQSLDAAATYARDNGISVHILSDAIEGEASQVGNVLASIALHVQAENEPFRRPCVILSGGETTVTMDQNSIGKGGRNTEFGLAFARRIAGSENILALSADTDGIDGSEDNAGAFIDGGTFARIKAAGFEPSVLQKNHDAWTAFDSANDLFVTGPTGTNVNDFRAILVL